MATRVTITKQLAAASANNIAASQSPGSNPVILNGSAVVSGVAVIDTFNANTNSAPGRQVIIVSGGNDSGITFLITGTNGSGNLITEVLTGASIGTATSVNSFVTVTSIVPSGAVAGTVTAGTNGVGASSWLFWNWMGKPPFQLSVAVELVSGSANFTVQYTYDNPNALPDGVTTPLPFPFYAVNGATATAEGSIVIPAIATRLLINSGTGLLRARFVQAGVG